MTDPSRGSDRDAARLREIDAEISARWGEGRMSPTRERIEALLHLLGDPQRAYRTVHLTGTNGKTTTARMVDELLRGFGLRTGRFTSPHLSSVTERIVLDGAPISSRTFVAAYEEIAPYLALVDERFDIRLSFFEVITALGYAVFADAPVDVAVVEVGLGGTWDATNVIDATVAVVTPIGLDHMNFLGDTVAQIAREKAGIIKAGSTAILAAQPTEAAAELLRRATEVEATVAREGLEFGVLDRQVAVGGQLLTLQGLGGSYDEIFLPLYGAHHAQNAAVALAATEAFFGADATSGPIDIDTVRAAFAAVRSPGRLEAVRSAPTILLDAAHNPHGMVATVDAVSEAFDFRRLVGVVGVLADKDARGMLEILEPALDEIVITQSSSPRAVVVDELAAAAVDVFGADRVTVEPRLDDALEAAVRLAEESDDVLAGAGVLVTGSVYLVGEARTLLAGTSPVTVGPPDDDGPPDAGPPDAGSPDGAGEPGDDATDPARTPTEEELAERRARANRATRGALAAILCLEAFAVLLMPRAIAQTSTGLGAFRVTVLVGLAVVLVAVGALLRRPWGIGAGSVLQLPVIAVGFWAPVFLIAVALFLAVWLYLLNLRHEIVGTPGGARMLIS